MSKNLRSLFLLLAMSSVASADLIAQERTGEVALEKLVREIVRDNPELKFYEAEVAAAKGELRTAGTWANPDLGLTVGRKEQQERGGGLSREGAAWSVSVTQTFEYPGRIGLRKAIANGQLRMAELGLQRFRRALAARARLLGFELLGRQELAEAARKVTARSQELVSVLVQREPSGIAPLLETRILQASLLELRREAVEAETEARSALFVLNQLRGRELASPIVVAPTDIKLPVPRNVEQLVQAAAEHNLDLQIQRGELESQGFKVALSRNERWPSISIGPFYSEERALEDERTAGVSLSIPLPAWNHNSGNIAASRAREQQARASLLMTQLRIEQEVREKALAYELLLAEMSKWPPNVSTDLREAAALGDQHYRLGAVPIETYVELQERYLSGLRAINRTRVDALSAVQDLELLTGETLLSVQPVSRKERGGEVKGRTRMAAFLAAVLIAGCGGKAKEDATPPQPEIGIAYREGKGLEVSDATKIAIELRTVEVKEGVFASRLVKAGTVIDAGDGLSGMRIRVSVALKPDEAKAVRPGQAVFWEGTNARGEVSSVSDADPVGTHDAEAVVAFDAPVASGFAHSRGNVVFDLPPVEASAIVPKSALLKTSTGSSVYVPNGKYFFRTAVTTGRESEDAIEVVEGLYPGDDVVSSPVMTLWLAELQAIKGGVSCADGH